MLKFFRVPFATSGDKLAVPDAADVNGNVSYTEGYGFDYQRQETDPDKKDIERDKMNQILFDLTTAVSELQSQGIPDFITTALNGGSPYSYSQYAVARFGGVPYISLINANTSTPADLTKWAPLPTPDLLQHAAYTSAYAGGTANAITADFSPAIAALPAAPGTLSVLVRAGAANTTVNPTFAANGTTAKVIVKGNNVPLVPSDIAGAGHWLLLQYDATNDRWVLLNPAQGIGNTIQRGQGTTGAGGEVVITFARPFANTNYEVQITDRGAAAWSSSNVTAYGTHSKTTTTVTVRALNWNGAAFALFPGGDFDYVAIGD